MKKTKQNNILNQLLKLIFLLFIGSFFEETTCMEPFNENNDDSSEKESWSEWLYKNKTPILVIFLVIILLPFFFDKNNIIDTKNIQEVFHNLNQNMTILHSITTEELYLDFFYTISDIKDNLITKEEGVKILKSLIHYKDNLSLVWDKKEFEKITEKIIDEIEKL